ncbi:RNA-binding protein 1-like [Hordeum vulgare]|uniref:RRM domain-containing protein n=1 Tax=Hordeum vulgare subsp. vulgare TaxID=112509 RepID=A0A8I7BI93_HORVV|nr:RNA-binding protein 2-like [Hordeum vulgare subsp. vulgare]KAE8776950.1 RNA-binding protein 1-like [Hordeum vulgare]
MGDPYRPYVPSSSHDRVPLGSYPGYVPPEESSYYASKMAALRGVPNIPRVDVPLQSRAYGLDVPTGVSHPAYGLDVPAGVSHPAYGLDIQAGVSHPAYGLDVPAGVSHPAYGLDVPAGVSHPALVGLGGLPAGARPQGPSPLEDPALVQRSSSLGKSVSIPEVERPKPLLMPSEDESNILFVDGLPTDCTRREVAHLFRPFVGFKDLRLVHKEPRRSGDKAYALCFVEFSDAKCAGTAMEALQGYRIDERKADGPFLKIQFARFPFRPPPANEERKRPSAR